MSGELSAMQASRRNSYFHIVHCLTAFRALHQDIAESLGQFFVQVPLSQESIVITLDFLGSALFCPKALTIEPPLLQPMDFSKSRQ